MIEKYLFYKIIIFHYKYINKQDYVEKWKYLHSGIKLNVMSELFFLIFFS